MFRPLVFSSLATLAVLTSCHPTVERNVAGPAPNAVYFITDQQTTGQIAALPIETDGRVSAGTLTPLGSGPPANETELSLLSAQYSIIVVENVSNA